VVKAEELELDPGSAAQLAKGDDRTSERNLQTLRGFATQPLSGRPRRIHLRFLVSPVELIGQERVERIKLVRNRLVPNPAGDLKAEATGEFEEIPVGLVFRSVGYLGVALPELPFERRRGVVPNERGRVLWADGPAIPGCYVAGWIKRGPSGVIGTNKPDSVETVDQLLEDLAAGKLPEPKATPADLDRLLHERGIRVVTWSDWQRLDALESAAGKALGRPRVKLTRVAEMLGALDQ